MAASAEMTTVRMIVRLPEERERSTGRKANAALAACRYLDGEENQAP